MAKLTVKQEQILAELVKAQTEREAIPESEKFAITNPEKYSFPIGISEAELRELKKKRRAKIARRI